MPKTCLIIGSGPAALIAADTLLDYGWGVKIFEKRPSAGWKLLVAGSSGLNITHEGDLDKFCSHYSARQKEMRSCVENFTPENWIAYLEALGEPTYLGSSGRFFLKNKTAAQLLQKWLARITAKGAEIFYGEDFVNFDKKEFWEIEFRSGRRESASKILFALGGASWEKEKPTWLDLFAQKGIPTQPFAPANAGYSLDAPAEFFSAAAGKPIKGLILSTAKGTSQGELMITHYGLEGTPIYTNGCPGPAKLDLKPDINPEKLLARLDSARGTVWQRVENSAKLSPGALLLLRYLGQKDFWQTTTSAVAALKNFSVQLLSPRPLSECISSQGGIDWDALKNMELKKFPGLFCAGEMLDWDAPTGGYLLQGCVATGKQAAEAIQQSC